MATTSCSGRTNIDAACPSAALEVRCGEVVRRKCLKDSLCKKLCKRSRKREVNNEMTDGSAKGCAIPRSRVCWRSSFLKLILSSSVSKPRYQPSLLPPQYLKPRQPKRPQPQHSKAHNQAHQQQHLPSTIHPRSNPRLNLTVPDQIPLIPPRPPHPRQPIKRIRVILRAVRIDGARVDLLAAPVTERVAVVELLFFVSACPGTCESTTRACSGTTRVGG